MSDIEFIGMIQAQKVSEIHPARGPAIDRDYVRAFAQAHENAGFDRVLVPHHSTGPDATLTVAYAASVTERIHFMHGRLRTAIARVFDPTRVAGIRQQPHAQGDGFLRAFGNDHLRCLASDTARNGEVPCDSCAQRRFAQRIAIAERGRAGGSHAKAGDTRFTLSAERGSLVNGIVSNPFIERAFTTVAWGK